MIQHEPTCRCTCERRQPPVSLTALKLTVVRTAIATWDQFHIMQDPVERTVTLHIIQTAMDVATSATTP